MFALLASAEKNRKIATVVPPEHLRVWRSLCSRFPVRTCVAGSAALYQHMENVEGRHGTPGDTDLFVENTLGHIVNESSIHYWCADHNARSRSWKIYISRFVKSGNLSTSSYGVYRRGKIDFVADLCLYKGRTFQSSTDICDSMLQLVCQKGRIDVPDDFGRAVLEGFDLTCVQFSIDDYKHPTVVRALDSRVEELFDKKQMVYDHRKYTNSAMMWKRITKYQERGFDLVGIDLKPHLTLEFGTCKSEDILSHEVYNGDAAYLSEIYEKLRGDPLGVLVKMGYGLHEKGGSLTLKVVRKKKSHKRKRVCLGSVLSDCSPGRFTRSNFKKACEGDWHLTAIPKTISPITRAFMPVEDFNLQLDLA